MIEYRKYKVLFADLDGTLIDTRSGYDFPTDINDWVLKSDVINKIYQMGIERLHIVTNQGGISKGYFTKNDIVSKLNRICSNIRTYTDKPYSFIVSYDICESDKLSDRKRKPNTGMYEDFFKLCGSRYSKSDCLMIGDASGMEGNFSDSDLKSAENFGIDYLDVNDFVNEEIREQ